jgi:hypothetical protein
MEMMNYAEKHSSYYCGWSDDGLALVIRNPQEFVRRFLPKFFKGGLKFQSFQRKLYRWGFRVFSHYWKRVAKGDEIIVYRAELFQRDRNDLIYNMQSVTAATRKSCASKTSHLLSSFGSRWEQPPPASCESQEAAQVSEEEGSHSSSSSSSDEGNISPLTAEPPALEDSFVSFAALKSFLLTDNEASLASMFKMYDLEPNPIMNSQGEIRRQASFIW